MRRIDGRHHQRGFEVLEGRRLLSAVGFARQEIDADVGVVSSLLQADLDGDTDPDVLAVFADADELSMVWYRNADGLASFGGRQLIDNLGSPVTEPSIQVSDLDADGDMDVVALILFARDNGEVLWYENDGTGKFASAQFIAAITPELGLSHTLRIADLDADGGKDIVTFVSDAASSLVGEVAWYARLEDEVAFGPATRIAAGVELGGLVEIMDLDADGDMDLVTSHLNAPTSGGLWWSANDGEGNFADPVGLVDYPADGIVLPTALDFVDVDGDDIDDVVTTGAFLATSRVDYFRQAPGQTFTHQALLGANGETTSFVQGEDLDLDGDVDVVAGGRQEAVWFEQSEVTGEFAEPRHLVDARIFAAIDLNQDDYIDLLGADEQGIAWFENRIPGDADGNGTVEFADFLKLSQRFGESEAAWEDGDFDHDGTVGFSDFLTLSKNFGARRAP